MHTCRHADTYMHTHAQLHNCRHIHAHTLTHTCSAQARVPSPPPPHTVQPFPPPQAPPHLLQADLALTSQNSCTLVWGGDYWGIGHRREQQQAERGEGRLILNPGFLHAAVSSPVHCPPNLSGGVTGNSATAAVQEGSKSPPCPLSLLSSVH